MRTYQICRGWAQPILDDAGYHRFTQYPGPSLPDVPDGFVLWSRYGGPGESLEGVLDDIAWQVRVAGPQNDYDLAETVADLLDHSLLSMYSQHVGGVYVTRVQRVGGAPSVLMVDDADRTHFVCSYNIETELALAN